MSTTVTSEQVQSVLTALAEEFTVDIPAVHNETGYWIEFSELNATLLLTGREWADEIADHINSKE